jgi:hypothetical protein
MMHQTDLAKDPTRTRTGLGNKWGRQHTTTVHDTTIKTVNTLKCLGKEETASESDQPATYSNLTKAYKSWGRISTILQRQGATPKTSGNFYKVLVQATLLYASTTWTATQQDLVPINSFHHCAAQQITNILIKCVNNKSNECAYPATPLTLDIAGRHPISTYINKQKE